MNRVIKSILLFFTTLTLLLTGCSTSNFSEPEIQQIAAKVGKLLEANFSEDIGEFQEGKLIATSKVPIHVTYYLSEIAFSSNEQELIHLKYERKLPSEDTSAIKNFSGYLYCTVLLRKKNKEWLLRRIYLWKAEERKKLSSDYPQGFIIVCVNEDGRPYRYGVPIQSDVDIALNGGWLLPSRELFLFLSEPERFILWEDSDTLNPLEHYKKQFNKIRQESIPSI